MVAAGIHRVMGFSTNMAAIRIIPGRQLAPSTTATAPRSNTTTKNPTPSAPREKEMT